MTSAKNDDLIPPEVGDCDKVEIIPREQPGQ